MRQVVPTFFNRYGEVRTMIDWDRSATPWWHDLIGPSVSNKLAEMLVHVTCDEEDGFRSIELASEDSSLANQSGWIDSLDLLCCF